VKSHRMLFLRGAVSVIAAIAFASPYGRAQQLPATSSASAPVDGASARSDLQDQVRELRTMVEEMRAENAQSRAEMEHLRQDLQATRALL
jgi:hypothetical protein